MATARTIKIDVISDTVCPWCFVGKRRLEEAMSQMKDSGVVFDVQWHPFQLDADAPVEGRNKAELYTEKFGAAKMAQMMPRMLQTFSELGLTYSLGGMTGNTLDSHRLINWAFKVGGAGAQDCVVEYLFAAYFCKERFINDRTLLVEAADSAGLPGAAEYLADPNAGLAEVQAELRAARARAVSGVPNFTINGKVSLSGAQDPSTFVSAFKEVLSSQAP
ncbi:hypothetical protein FOA52_013981 [Chlamydomonas sp. UWO 241]|nr:hypothetical protein FOA52_013981 [Chlamydomonas sp. UWO 241]